MALEIVNSNGHGNGTAIFTRSGPAARKFQDEVQVTLAEHTGPVVCQMCRGNCMIHQKSCASF